jgi:gamma-aminobutyric acid type B receptor
MYEFADMDVQAIIPVGGWPMFDKDGWKEFVNANREKNLTLIVGDTLEVQMQSMNEGYVDGLVGQLPFEMGKDSIDVLLSLSRGEEVDEMRYVTAFLEVLRFPLVLPPIEVDENYIEGLAILGYVLFALIAAVSLGLMVWTQLHKNTRVIKASQPFFLQMIIVGILIFSSAIVPLTIDTDRHSQEASDIACMTVPWLLTVGFTTTVSALQIMRRPVFQISLINIFVSSPVCHQVLCPLCQDVEG